MGPIDGIMAATFSTKSLKDRPTDTTKTIEEVSERQENTSSVKMNNK